MREDRAWRMFLATFDSTTDTSWTWDYLVLFLESRQLMPDVLEEIVHWRCMVAPPLLGMVEASVFKATGNRGGRLHAEIFPVAPSTLARPPWQGLW